MGASDTPNKVIDRLPPLGDYDLNFRAQKVAEIVWAAGTDTTNFLAVAASDSDSFVDWLVDTQETFAAIECGYDNVFVKTVDVRIVTAFTASVAHTVGDTDDADAYRLAANIGSTTAGVTAPNPTSDEGGSDELYRIAGGKMYDGSSSDDSVDIVIGAADPAAGRAAMYISYFVCDNAFNA